MNGLFIILIIVNYFSHLNVERNYELKEPDLVLKSVLKGVYNIPRTINESGNDSVYFFLVEVDLINNSHSSFKFLTMSCAAGANIVFDLKNVKICISECSDNSLTTIALDPKQKFSVLAILKTNKEDIHNVIKIGWILLTDKNIGNPQNYYNMLGRGKTKFENVLWSDPIELGSSGGRPYEIKN